MPRNAVKRYRAVRQGFLDRLIVEGEVFDAPSEMPVGSWMQAVDAKTPLGLPEGCSRPWLSAEERDERVLRDLRNRRLKSETWVHFPRD